MDGLNFKYTFYVTIIEGYKNVYYMLFGGL
jgi:hypothetical protein